MNIKVRNLVMVLIVGGILTHACERDLDEVYPNKKIEIDKITPYGEKLENPFSVENMKRALDTILVEAERSKNEGLSNFQKSLENIEIKATDLYVRFLPRDSFELEFLKKDTSLVFYEYPLDNSMGYQADHDPVFSLSEGPIPWQYTVVKPDYVFPDIKYQILSPLFIPENSEDYHQEEINNTQKGSRYSKTFCLDRLETVSLYLTDNLSKEEKEQIEAEKKQALKSATSGVWFILWNKANYWNPSGKVRIEDTELGWQPVEGVKVRARRWFITKSGITDSEGNFRLGRFKRRVNYSLVWETYQFSIREKWSWSLSRQAVINGPKMKEAWNVNLTKHSKHWFQGTIFQAAHHYYYKDNKGLKRPPTNSFWKPQMKIRAHFEINDNRNGNHCKGCRMFGIVARIRIYNPSRSSFEIYASTIHELAHASHWELRKHNWSENYLSSKIKESWAEGVTWELTRMKYPNYQGVFWNTNQNNHTLVVVDMIDQDGFNAANHGFFDSRDQVSGYTIKQIEDVLSTSSSWIDWRDNIINSYNNPTENNLEKLFKSYE